MEKHQESILKNLKIKICFYSNFFKIKRAKNQNWFFARFQIEFIIYFFKSSFSFFAPSSTFDAPLAAASFTSSPAL
ncbi:hypothetical protein PMI13_03557 [Chryseobacterium populi]|uniref:Uncharacterized protein n=1 Tax=Chryseobacterium populi TaxID=1144316 RepID=J2JL99_9FLAO|nr:hypothetical protein PMI13_03557 [Chryseobacterium populi]